MATNDMPDKTLVQHNNDETPRFQDILALCLDKWEWFILSLILCVGAASLYILNTTPTYTRTTSILIKEDGKGASSFANELSSMADMGMFKSASNVNNELICIQSPAVILEVIKRLNLDVDYSEEGFFRDKVLYGQNVPAQVHFLNIAINDKCQFDLLLKQDNSFEIQKLTYNNEAIENTYQGVLGDTIQLPFAKVIVTPSQYAASNDNKTERVIHISRSGLINCTDSYKAKLTAALANKQTTIIDLTFVDASIQRAEDFLNTLYAVYNENWIKDKNQIAVSTSHFINERLHVIASELKDIDSDISTYKSDNLIPDMDAAANMYMNQANQANAQILELNNQLYMARYVKQFISGPSNNQLLPANVGINSSVVEQAITSYNEKLLQRNSLVANSSERNPIVMDYDKQLADMRGALVVSIDNVINSLNHQIAGLKSTEQINTSKMSSNPKQAEYLLSVGRQQKVKESLYLFLLQKREENELSQAFTAYNTRIVTPPVGRLKPTAPLKRNILLAALLLGLIIPIAAIYVLELANTKVRGRKDIEHLTIPFIGEIPSKDDCTAHANTNKLSREIAFVKKDLQDLAAIFKRKPNREQDTYEIVVKKGSRNTMNEAFRVVRTNLEFMLSNIEGEHNIIMMTSANPGSGKTYLTANIAVSLALKEKKIAIVDLDLRRASLSTMVNKPNTGLSNYLSNKIDTWQEIVVKDNLYPNVDVIPVGTLPPNPTELLFNPKLEAMLKDLKEQYDYIFLDCPPIEIVTDSDIINQWCDMTIFTIRAYLFEKDMLPDIQKYYDSKRLKNMGLILNETRIYNNNNKYGYRYGYHYGYGSYE